MPVSDDARQVPKVTGYCLYTIRAVEKCSRTESSGPIGGDRDRVGGTDRRDRVDVARSEFAMNSPGTASRELRSLMASVALEPGADSFETAGHRSAVAFLAFAEWVAEEAQRRDISSVFLLSREGPFLKAVMEQVAVSVAELDVLEVSRVATFLPSMPDFETPTMMRMWERFPLQSPSGMLAGIGLESAMFSTLLERFDLEPGAEIFEPWKDKRIQGFLASPEFTESAMSARDEARELLLKYLDQKGYLGATNVALVDVGWRGTIQDSLARLVPSVQSTGMFMAYRPADLPQYSNTSKIGFLAGEAGAGRLFGQELRMAASPLEMFSTCPGGSTVGYDMCGSRAMPRRAAVEAEEVFLRSEVQRFQNAVLSKIDALGGSSGIVELDRRRAVAQASLKSVLFDPDPAVISTFEAYQLDPSIGGGQDIPADRPHIGSAFSSGGRRAIKEQIQRHGWPHALVKKAIGERAYRAVRISAHYAGQQGRWWI